MNNGQLLGARVRQDIILRDKVQTVDGVHGSVGLRAAQERHRLGQGANVGQIASVDEHLIVG